MAAGLAEDLGAQLVLIEVLTTPHDVLAAEQDMARYFDAHVGGPASEAEAYVQGLAQRIHEQWPAVHLSSTLRTTPTGGVRQLLEELLAVRWRPNPDLAAVGLSWVLVVASLSAATFIATGANGILYFLLYGVLGATVFGFGLPVAWMTLVRRRPITDLGLTTRHWKISLALQLVFAAVQFRQTLASAELPPLMQLAPVLSLVLAIGLFEAVFWRGWVLLRLEEAFGLMPAVLLGSALYGGSSGPVCLTRSRERRQATDGQSQPAPPQPDQREDTKRRAWLRCAVGCGAG
jgi:hypothetical protein